MSESQPLSPPTPDDPEDRKIITLARASRARAGTAQGACVRDGDGRTYAATNVALESLTLSAIQLAVAMAVSSSAPGLEAVALVADDDPTAPELALVREVASRPVVVWLVGSDGAVRDRVEA
ncbi:cytidine deaminase [Microlunatus ginsengisoli]|uniref:Cytidine deaminase n=1 Tax=Microlunatus ginsengisoli TaxID=363863 RepID=A0ABP6ZNW3_9ACTN